jgi:transcription-repair coupling factor (superfamily II helicase)
LLLERAVRALKEGRQPELDRPLDHGAEIDLRVPALIPADYMPDVHARLIFYKRIASAADPVALDEIQVEMIDRFGLLPEPTQSLVKITALKLRTTPLGIRKIELGGSGGRIVFKPNPPVDFSRLIKLVQTQPRHYRPDPDNNLRISKDLPDLAARVGELERLLGDLGGGRAV